MKVMGYNAHLEVRNVDVALNGTMSNIITTTPMAKVVSTVWINTGAQITGYPNLCPITVSLKNMVRICLAR